MMRNLCYTQWPSVLSDQLYKSTPIRLQPASKMQNEQLIGLISLWGVQGFNTIKTWLESQDSQACNYLSQALHLIRDLLTKKSMVAIYRQSTYKIQGGLIKAQLNQRSRKMHKKCIDDGHLNLRLIDYPGVVQFENLGIRVWMKLRKEIGLWHNTYLPQDFINIKRIKSLKRVAKWNGKKTFRRWCWDLEIFDK